MGARDAPGHDPCELADFAVDGLTPQAVVTPRDATQVRATLREAQECGLAVVPVGGHQHLGAGNAPSRYDVALSLTEMRAVVAHEPADMTVTVEPGLPLAELNARLAAHGQTLPLDPPCDAAATVGGVLAANAFGPLRHVFGTARDWLIGASLAQADGGASKSGGRVVKNVTGYDMHKLYAGSLGTLGVVTQATFKLAPLPAASRTLIARVQTASAACAAVLAADDAGLALHAAEVVSPEAAAPMIGTRTWLVALRVAGGRAAVERTLRDLPRCGGAVTFDDGTDALWEAWTRAFSPAALSLRAALLPSAVAPALDALTQALADAAPQLSATAARGVVRVQLAAGAGAAAVARARDAVARHGGTLVVDAAPPEVKDAGDVFGPARSDAAIMRRLKQQFDPGGTLSPGRFAGRL